MLIPTIQSLFPFLIETNDIVDRGSPFMLKEFPKGAKLFNDGDECGAVAFVLRGTIRVSKIGRNGREVNLYRLKSGDSCILTISSVLSDIPYPATATVEEDLEVMLVTVQQFKTLMETNVDLQQYIYRMLSERFIEVMTLIDEIIFRKIDERLIEFLLRKVDESGNLIEITHDEMAIELGTAREVISRMIKGLERDGLIELARGKVHILEYEKLAEKLAEF